MPQTSLEGQSIGKYRVLEALGRGGMGRVFRAYHPQLDRYVAIKVLRPELVEDPELIVRFQREARAIASLRHPNIVQVFDFDIQDDLYYMVMELLDGDSLRTRLNQFRTAGERMPLIDVMSIMMDCLQGLGFAHQQGIIHRDIKPANIMLNQQGQAVITDFGIAQIVGSVQITNSGVLMGTPSYMAPEQGLRGQCDQRSDLYSLGILFYEMLTGYTPFDADTPLAILMKHLHDPLPLPRQVDPAIPAALERIVLKALAKDVDDRFQTAEEMTAALGMIVLADLPAGPRNLVPPPAEAGAKTVYSGIARQKIQDQRFSHMDTEPNLEQTLANEERLLNHAITPRQGAHVTGAILGGLGAILLFNFLAGLVMTINGVSLFKAGWTFELFLIAGFLSVLMSALNNRWLLIPSLLILGSSICLTYTSISGRWNDWAFLWMLELLFIGAAIYLPIRIGPVPEKPFPDISKLGFFLAITSFALAGLTCFLAWRLI